MEKSNILQNKIKRFVICLLLSCTLTGCADFLDKAPHNSISEQTFWTDEDDARLALVGCYRFNNGWTSDDFATAQGLLYLDLAGGNGTEKENFTSLMASTNTLATNSNILRFWQNAYRMIAKYNIFLANIDRCPMNDATRKAMTAEVKSLRAYMFLNMAFYFKDVPMPLAPMTADEANSIAQTPQTDVYKQIEADLKESISVLPEEYADEEYGRLTKGAAEALLGRLYLAQNRYDDAAGVFRAVIDSKTYELDRRNGAESYEKLFQIGGETSPEMIFFVHGLKDKYTTTRYQYLYPEAMGGWHQFAVYNELVKDYFCSDGKSIETSTEYDDTDPYANRELRLYASVFLPPTGSYAGTEFNGITYNCFNGSGSSDYYNKYTMWNGYCPKKGCDPSVTENLTATPTYTPLIRHAEVLLSYLEALNESKPAEVSQQVLDLTINDIRDRVSLPPLKKTDIDTQEKVRQAVRKERRVELAFEGLRYFDVLRWGIAKEELNRTFHGVKLSDDKNAPNYKGTSKVDSDNYYEFESRTWAPHNRYFPIPQNDLNINKNLRQNDGYN